MDSWMSVGVSDDRQNFNGAPLERPPLNRVLVRPEACFELSCSKHGVSCFDSQTLQPRPQRDGGMKIGIVTEYYYPTLGGIQEHVHHFAKAARQLGHEVRIVTPEVRDNLASVGVGRGRPVDTASQDRESGVIRLGVSVPVFSGSSIARASSAPSDVAPARRRRPEARSPANVELGRGEHVTTLVSNDGLPRARSAGVARGGPGSPAG